MARASKLARWLAGVAAPVAVIAATGNVGGCRDATEATLVITLDRRAKCSEIPTGTAITSGVDPADVEGRVGSHFVTAKTLDCDETTGIIGTLVLTPSDADRAAVVVVVGYKGQDPAACSPPKYDGCIVARRRFAFVDHTPLTLPITIDPDCASVPCDAFSTCTKGLCFDSTTRCSGSSCGEPGALPDGGVDEAGVVEAGPGSLPDSGPDSGPDLDAAPEASGPSGDAAPEASGPTSACTAAGELHCGGGAACAPDESCCAGTCSKTSCAGGVGEQSCCIDQAVGGQCPSTAKCNRPSAGGPPGTCEPIVLPASCAGPNVVCGGATCSTVCCSSSSASCSTNPACATPEDQLCCSAPGATDGCPSGYQCHRTGSGPGTCEAIPPPGPSCNTTTVTCGGFSCDTAHPCCAADESQCSATGCATPNDELCCDPDGSQINCPQSYQCNRPNLAAPGQCGPVTAIAASCTGTQVNCGGASCGADVCCSSDTSHCNAGAPCGQPTQQLCCDPDLTTGSCPVGYRCNHPNAATPGACEAIPAPTCNGSTLSCGGLACAAVCCTTNPNACATAATCDQNDQQLCCSADGTQGGCQPGFHCHRSGTASTPGICQADAAASCNGAGGIVCGGTACSPNACCSSNPSACSGSAECAPATNQLCCIDNGTTGQCPTGYRCSRTGSNPGQCVPVTPPPPSCAGTELYCGGQDCTASSCCAASPNACNLATTCPGGAGDEYCCSNASCDPGYVCQNPGVVPGRCVLGGPPTCTNGGVTLSCGGQDCSATACCLSSPSACSATCPGGQSDTYCCTDADCDPTFMCGAHAPGSPASCVPRPVGTYPSCNGAVLQCNAGQACGGRTQACCPDDPNPPVCLPQPNCSPDAGATGPPAYCCSDNDCPVGKPCLLVVAMGVVPITPDAGASTGVGTCTP